MQLNLGGLQTQHTWCTACVWRLLEAEGVLVIHSFIQAGRQAKHGSLEGVVAAAARGSGSAAALKANHTGMSTWALTCVRAIAAAHEDTKTSMNACCHTMNSTCSELSHGITLHSNNNPCMPMLVVCTCMCV